MTAWDGRRKLYIEIMRPNTAEQISLHLSHHLPRRLQLGKVIIITDRPRVMLAVLGKRWAALIRDIEREQSRTLDHTKRVFLGQEIARMKAFRFSARRSSPGDALVATWDDITTSQLNCFTLYVTVPLDPQTRTVALAFISTGGLLVQYDLPQQ